MIIVRHRTHTSSNRTLGKSDEASIVGRGQELARVMHWCLAGHRKPIQIVGPRGMGKTTLLRAAARRFGRRLYGGIYETTPASDNDEVLFETAQNETVRLGRDLAWVGSVVLATQGSAVVAIDDCQEFEQDRLRDWIADLTVRRPDFVCLLASAASISDHWHALCLDGLSDRAAAELLRMRPDGGADAVNRAVRGVPSRLVALRDAYFGDGYRFLNPERIEVDLRENREPTQQPSSSSLVMRAVSDSLIAFLDENPLALYQLEPRKFEELLAELYARHGFKVELTQATRDGGADLLVVKHAPYGRSLTLVDAKRRIPDRPITVSEVRTMYGTLSLRDATAGVIATTSYFTPDAREVVAEHEFRLGLQEFSDVLAMLRSVARR